MHILDWPRVRVYRTLARPYVEFSLFSNIGKFHIKVKKRLFLIPFSKAHISLKNEKHFLKPTGDRLQFQVLNTLFFKRTILLEHRSSKPSKFQVLNLKDNFQRFMTSKSSRSFFMVFLDKSSIHAMKHKRDDK